MFKNIVWATDGSEHADRALEFATQIARGDGAAVLAVHVVEQLASLRVAGSDARVDEKQIERKIDEQVGALRSEHGLRASTSFTATAGNVAKRIAEVSHEAGADLIVVGTRGHSAVIGTVLGSVTQRLLHLAHCPVLAVPPLGQAGDGEAAAGELSGTG